MKRKVHIRLPDTLTVPVLRHAVLGVDVLRGYARLCDLALISRADIFDQKTNPRGTQRDLSPKHARDAYLYIRNEEFAFWPEIFLCVRDANVISVSTPDANGLCRLTFKKTEIAKSSEIKISRVDGNHRLHFAGGDTEGYEPITKVVSFCLARSLTLDEEIKLFKDINNNQRRMSTSHLDNITTRLTEEEKLKYSDPPLYIAKKLATDLSSPLKGLVNEGGKPSAIHPLPLRGLKTGIGYMLSRPTNLTALEDRDAQFKVIRNYFLAIKKWIPEVFKEPQKHVALRGAGFWGVCFIGAEVIHRVLGSGSFQTEAMLEVLRSGKTWDWSNNGSFKGLSGRGGATEISGSVISEFQDKGGVSVKQLFKQIMDE